MSAPRVVVVGSSNTDMVIKSKNLPRVGETVIGGEFFMAAGGKGANQAVAASRAGAHTTFVARLGDDMFGRKALENFQKEAINTDFLVIDREAPSGIALIFIDAQGENIISVAPGANARLSPEDVERAEEAISRADVTLMELEIALETVERAVEMASAAAGKVILNPAPGRKLPSSLLARIDFLTPNETEAALLTELTVDSNKAAERAGEKLRGLGVGAVIITRGRKGALIVADSVTHIPAKKVKAVDTVGAGDAFNGALAVAIAEGRELKEAVEFAAAAGALACTRYGAQPSMPSRKEIDEIMRT
ncbi:MAG: ribokinase [Planctomycetes bacterium DG_23]|nr:MAG: ribokinase [Planctomycetes bacterium DG_23]